MLIRATMLVAILVALIDQRASRAERHQQFGELAVGGQVVPIIMEDADVPPRTPTESRVWCFVIPNGFAEGLVFGPFRNREACEAIRDAFKGSRCNESVSVDGRFCP